MNLIPNGMICLMSCEYSSRCRLSKLSKKTNASEELSLWAEIATTPAGSRTLCDLAKKNGSIDNDTSCCHCDSCCHCERSEAVWLKIRLPWK